MPIKYLKNSLSEASRSEEDLKVKKSVEEILSSIESDGAVISGNNLLINSGYLYGGRLGGNVLLNFEVDEDEK